MADGWKNSNRRSRLPSNWAALRTKVFRLKGSQCHAERMDGTRCKDPATDIDHIVAGDDHSINNLQPLCSYHHASKSGREGWDALRKKRAKVRWDAERRFGWKEDHPGKNPKTTFKHPWQ